jgi:alpha-galactosidase
MKLKNNQDSILNWIYLGFLLLLISSCCNGEKKGIVFEKGLERSIFESEKIKLDINQSTEIVVYRKSGHELLSLNSDGDVPHYLVVNGKPVNKFTVDKDRIELSELEDKYGTGKRLLLIANAEGPLGSVIEKKMSIDIYQEFPEVAIINITYRNVNSTKRLFIDKEVNNHFTLDASRINNSYDKHAFWILQGGSYKERPDWILPVTENFSAENYQGQQFSKGEVGGGLPVLDVWCKESGFLIGSLRDKPTLISLPASVNSEDYLEISIEYDREKIVFRDHYKTIPTIIGVHNGDYYNGLRTYSKIMSRNGFKMPEPPEDAYEAIWCGWGFGPDFTQEQMIEMIPVIKDLGFKVATVDAGWFYNNGDYDPRDDTFPLGEVDMKDFVKKFHNNGLKIKLWITTDIAGPEIASEHPGWLLRNELGEEVGFDYMKVQTTPYLCPVVKEVQDYYRRLVRKFIGEWGYDGLKIDQSLINFVSRCYAPEHNHKYPEESVEALPEIFKIIYEEAVKLKPEAILEVCPCGMFPSFYNMPYYNQPVSSDFVNTWQIRHRGKTIKALMGPSSAYYGDHMERYYSEENLPSMIGVGGIPGTMFVSRPEDNVEFLRVKYPCYLSPERKGHLSKWLDVYNDAKLSKGEYLNLYDIVYDVPEVHVIKKEGIMYYSFYASDFDGAIEFRGLEEKPYTIIDYVNNRTLGNTTANGILNVKFEKHLFVKAIPTDN